MMQKEPFLFQHCALVLAGLVWFAAACDNMVDDPTPFSPTPQAIFVDPLSAVVEPGGTVTFTATNAVAPVTWMVSNTNLAQIGLTTGVLTAGTLAGTVRVTVTDANGKTGSATLTITTAKILVTPSTLTFNTLPVTAPDFNATGNVSTVTFSLSGASGGYTGATINTTTGVVTITAMPTLAQGNQTLTVTASDGIAVSDSATLILIA